MQQLLIQIKAGIIQEFRVYKHDPLKLFLVFITVIISFICRALVSYLMNDATSKLMTTISLFSEFFFFSPAWIMMSYAFHKSKLGIQNFIIVNGMSKLAYIAKDLLPNYLLIMIVALVKSAEVSIFTKDSTVSYFGLFCCYFLAALASINLCFLLLIFIQNQQEVLSISVAFFVFYPLFFNLNLDFIPKGLASGPIIINPFLRLKNIQNLWKEILFLIALNLMNVFLALFKTWATERSHRIKNPVDQKQKKEQKMQELSLFLIEDPSRIISSAQHDEGKLGSNKNPIVQIKNLKKIYKNETIPALEDITLNIFEKEIFCFLGHNGAGKTTLINILSGLIPSTEGVIYYGNQEINSKKIYKSIGFCAQNDLALTENTVYENLLFLANIRGVDKLKTELEIKRVLDKLNLIPYKNTLVSKLSQEQRKKLSIGIALLNNPQIIIMDEPTSGLDPLLRRSFWSIIKELKQNKKTVIFTTQFLDDAEELADRLTIIEKGKLFAVGSVEYIKKEFGAGDRLVIYNSKNPTQLAAQASEITAIITEKVPSAQLHTNTSLNILKYSLPFSEKHKFPQLFKELEKIQDIQISVQKQSLEEVYLGLGKNYEDTDRVQEEQSDIELRNLENDKTGTIRFLENKKTKRVFFKQLQAIALQKLYKFEMEKIVLVSYFLTICAISMTIFINMWFNKEAMTIKEGLNIIFFVSVLFQMCLCFISLHQMITDRSKHTIHVLKMMGLKSLSYWIGNIMTDSTFYSFFSLAYILGYNQLAQIGPKKIITALAVEIMSGLNIIIVAYNMSRWHPNVNYMSVTVTSLAGISVLLLLDLQMNDLLTHYLNWFRIVGFLVPHLYLCPGMYLKIALFSYLNGEIPDIWFYFVITSLNTVIQFFFLLHTDSQTLIYQNTPMSAPKVNQDANPLLIREKARVQAEDNQDMVKVLEIGKIYPDGCKAVDDLSFGVERGQIFCLLGPNGAGKTTTFDVIIKKIPNTCGKVLINGLEISKSTPKISVCLQSNTLWDTLTVKQHLKLYTSLIGLSGTEAKETVEYLMKVLSLKTHSDKQVQQLSGGTKRKLNVALAVLGESDLIVLDEPTTGVDPIGRSQIWNLLKTLTEKKKTTVLISTHYMEDAELVADKVGILVNGSLVTIGSLSELRERYVRSTLVIDGVAEGFTESLKTIIGKIIPKAELESRPSQRRMTFIVPAKAMKFARVYEELENLKIEEKIVEFKIYLTTLEETYFRYVKKRIKN